MLKYKGVIFIWINKWFKNMEKSKQFIKFNYTNITIVILVSNSYYSSGS